MRIFFVHCALFGALGGAVSLDAQQLTPLTTPDLGTVTVQIAPGRASLTLGATCTFTAYVSGTKNKGVNWLVNGISGGNSAVGTMSNGIYKAPASVPNPNTVSVQAQSQQTLSAVSTAAVVTVSNPTPVISAISPDPIPYGAFAMSVSGTGFVPGSQITYAGANLPTTFVSSTSLTASGTAVPVVGAMVAVAVVNPGTNPIYSVTSGVPLQEPAALVSYASAFHFLEQATFGPAPADIDNLQKLGFQQWFAQQFAAPTSTYTPNAPDIPTLQSDFFYNALTGPDQLRQRVSLALSEIFVISAFKNYQPIQYEPYLQLLQADAFGNFYNLINDITLSPTMGHYLDMANNVQAKNNVLPNENYGRELMQLFCTGPVLLNLDGTPQLDASQNTIPLYTETTIQNFARALTGWTYPVMPGATPLPINPTYFTGPMVAWEANHDTGAKTLLNGAQIPAGQTAEQDVKAALQNVFNHPNVGPFVSKMLIQHLVSSNPSPAYVQRIAQVFNSDASGTRGNLSAVVKAILLDTEARQSDSVSTWIPSGGHLREPVLFLTSVLRNLNASANGPNLLIGESADMGQQLFYPLSVASYFPPSYPLPGYPLQLGPEFDTLNSSSSLARANWVFGVSWGGTSSEGISLNLSSFVPLAKNPAALIQAVNNTFMAGQMSQPMQSAIATAVAATPNDLQGQVASAIYLTASSGYYQVQH